MATDEPGGRPPESDGSPVTTGEPIGGQTESDGSLVATPDATAVAAETNSVHAGVSDAVATAAVSSVLAGVSGVPLPRKTSFLRPGMARLQCLVFNRRIRHELLIV